jgi:hypothetical protein
MSAVVENLVVVHWALCASMSMRGMFAMKVSSRFLVLFLGFVGFCVMLVIAEREIPLRWDPTGALQIAAAIIAVAVLLNRPRFFAAPMRVPSPVGMAC